MILVCDQGSEPHRTRSASGSGPACPRSCPPLPELPSLALGQLVFVPVWPVGEDDGRFQGMSPSDDDSGGDQVFSRLTGGDSQP